MKKENARNILAESMSDEALWNAIGQRYRETFITPSGQRFAITVVSVHDHKPMDGEVGEPNLVISKFPHRGNMYVPKAVVIEAYHKAVEERAGLMEENASLGEYDEFLRPVFIYLGVLEGDRSKVTTRRFIPEEGYCSCCGRKSDNLFSVSSFQDLIRLDAEFDEERKASLTDEEREKSRVIDFMMAKEQEYWKQKKADQLAAARQSKAVESFEEEGERKLCKLCCQTIYDALLNGVLPPAKRIGGYDDVDDDELMAFIHEECSTAKSDYYQAHGAVLKAAEFDNSGMFLYEVMDNRGIKHSFALTARRIPYPEGDMGFGFDAQEVHRMTKAGKVTADSTDTDYNIQHFKMCKDGEDEEHVALVGLVELIEKIIDTIRMETLSESNSPAENLITINGHHYGIESLGTIIPTYVGYAENYMSMKGREWSGGDYGFLIDGKLFSGDEVALMFSCTEGAQIKYYADDPSSNPLRADECLMQVRLSQEELVNEVIDLINMFTEGGRFERDKDRENFSRMFEKYLIEKFRMYHESRPRGYGRLAGMEIIKRLKLVEGTEECQEMIRGILGK